MSDKPHGRAGWTPLEQYGETMGSIHVVLDGQIAFREQQASAQIGPLPGAATR